MAPKFSRKVELRLRDGWYRNGHHLPSVYPPIDWHPADQSFSYNLHAWDAIADLLIAAGLDRQPLHIDAARAHVGDWIETFQAGLLGGDDEAAIDTLLTGELPPQWYDMAVGRRVYRLAFLIELLVRFAEIEDAELETMWKTLVFHLRLLARDRFFSAQSNHGVYQALGQLAAARRFRALPGIEADFTQARERVRMVLADHFMPEGPHKEHSLGYHFMLLGSLLNARRSGLLEGQADIDGALRRGEEALAWMIQPDFHIATLGDTDPRDMRRGDMTLDIYDNQGLVWLLSDGEAGAPPRPGVRAYREAGYAFARLLPPGESDLTRAGYLAQMAAFHSRIHKQADHLAFVWHDAGRDILIDPGKFAYTAKSASGSALRRDFFWYADPRRVFVESTHAHNCVEIDGVSYSRGDAFWGSALALADEQDGMTVTDCAVRYWDKVAHRRILVMRPGAFLLVLDELDDAGAAHDYRQHFQLAADWEIEANAPDRVAAKTADGARLTAFSLEPDATLDAIRRGETEPRLAGWYSNEANSLVPTTSFAFHAGPANAARFATLFVLGDPSAAPKLERSAQGLAIEGIGGRLSLDIGAPGTVSARWLPATAG